MTVCTLLRWVAVFSVPLIAGCVSLEKPAAASCTYDRSLLMSLDENSFDQDMNGGWRALAKKDECLKVAADLIRDYREMHSSGFQAVLLLWHEGQLRATAGDSSNAIALFDSSRLPADVSPGWSEYVDATIAFLKKDRSSFDRARSALASLPRPANLGRDPAGKNIPWPPNLDVVDGLARCFNRTYKEAYGECPKRAPRSRPNKSLERTRDR
jgi:hypothetical protein